MNFMKHSRIYLDLFAACSASINAAPALQPLFLLQPPAAAADISSQPAGVAQNQAKRRHILSYNAAGSNHGILSHSYAADDGGIGSYAGASADTGGTDVLLIPDKGPGVEVIGEGGRWSHEHIVLYGHSLIDGDEVLNLDIVSYIRSDVDVDRLSYVAAVAYLRPATDMGKMPDLCALAYVLALHNGGGMGIVALARIHYPPQSSPKEHRYAGPF